MRRSSVTAVFATTALAIAAIVAVPTGAVADGAIEDFTVGDDPRGVVFSSDGEFAYIANAGADTVSKVDADTRTIVDTAAVGEEPINLALRPGSNELWVTSFATSTVSIIDLTTFNTVTTTVGSGGFRPYSIAFSPDGAFAFVVNYAASLIAKIDTTTRMIVDSVTYTDYFPEGIALNADGSALYVSMTSQGTVVKLSTATLDELTTITVGTFPVDVVLSPDGTQLWVTNNASPAGSISVISTATDTVIDTIPTGTYPLGLAFGWDGNVWVVHSHVSAGPAKISYATREYLTTDLPIGGEAFELAARPGHKELYATVNYDDLVQVLGTEVDRLQGPSRYETAVAISQAAYQSGAPVVYVATGTNYPDALAAGPAAAIEGGPVLLTQPGSLPAAVKTEIERLNPSSIVVLGSTAAVSASVATELATIAPVTRLEGANRYETSRAIIRDSFTTAPTVYLATGQNFPDALGAGNAGASSGTPVVLVNGLASAVDAATLDLLDDLATTDIKILGSAAAVSASIATQLSNEGFTVERLFGASRYDTNVETNRDAFATSEYAVFATGLNFPDALAGAALGGKVDAPLYIVPGSCVPAVVLSELDRLQTSFVVILGSPAALPLAVSDLVSCG